MKTDTKNLIALAAITASVAAAPLQALGAHIGLVRPSQGVVRYYSGLVNGNGSGSTEKPVPWADVERANQINRIGEGLLADGELATAEADFRQALALNPDDPYPYVGLAEALDAQGRTAEALEAYHALSSPPPNITSNAPNEIRTRMGYAIALSQTGQWREAVAVYEKALPETVHSDDAPIIDVHFNPDVPEPARLQAMAHVATGLEYTFSDGPKRAYVQFYQATCLDPDSALANYWCGFSWRQLDPKDKAQAISAQQAKADLQKAVRIGKGKVKKAAQKALLVAMKPK